MSKVAAVDFNENNNGETNNLKRPHSPFKLSKKRENWFKLMGAPTQLLVKVRSCFLNGKDKEICDFVKRNPDCCRESYSFGDGDLLDVYPLVIVCIRGCSSNARNRLSLETIQTVYNAYPKAIMCGNSEETSSYLPIHHVCATVARRSSSVEVLKFLCDKYPESVQMKEKRKGCLPLHLVLLQGTKTTKQYPAQDDMIQLLIERHPNATKERMKNGKLALHVAVVSNASLKTVELLVSKNPEALRLSDYPVAMIPRKERGWILHKEETKSRLAGVVKNFVSQDCGLPLHLACSRPESFVYVPFLVRKYPEALTTKNRCNYLPIHFACRAGAPLSLMELLVSCCPHSLLERTIDYRFPVDMCCSRIEATDLAVIQFLLSKHPTNTEPPKKLFFHYLTEAEMAFAPTKVTEFLKHVVRHSQEGYTYCPTNESSRRGGTSAYQRCR